MNTKEFMEKLEKDVDLQKKFEGVNQPEKFYELACENGLTDDFETMKAKATVMLKEAVNNGEVDINQLGEISGGMNEEEYEIVLTATLVGTVVSVAGGSIALASGV